MNLGCAILAGGPSSRVGGVNKALVEVDGIPIIQRILSIVSPLFSEVTIVTHQPDAFPPLKDVVFISDEIEGIGPLGGIYTALNSTSCDALLILAGDMPYLSGSFIQEQCDSFLKLPCEILVPRYEIGKKQAKDSTQSAMIEPLHSIYHQALIGKLKRYITNTDNHPVWDFFPLTDVRFLSIPNHSKRPRMFTNLNTKEDFSSSGVEF